MTITILISINKYNETYKKPKKIHMGEDAASVGIKTSHVLLWKDHQWPGMANGKMSSNWVLGLEMPHVTSWRTCI